MKIILIIIAVIVATIGLYKKDSWPLWLTLSISGLLVIGAIIQIVVEQRGARESLKLKYTGILKKKSGFLLSTRKNILPKMEMGNGGTIIIWTGAQGLIKIFDDNRLIILLEKGQVKVSALIRSKDGNLVAELIKNEWKVNRNNIFDRNYSKDALEVRDNTGDIVLQLKVLEDRIQFQAKFYDSHGNGVAVGKYQSGSGGIIEITGPAHPKLNMIIDPIFKYPSDSHLGELQETTR